MRVLKQNQPVLCSPPQHRRDLTRQNFEVRINTDQQHLRSECLITQKNMSLKTGLADTDIKLLQMESQREPKCHRRRIKLQRGSQGLADCVGLFFLVFDTWLEPVSFIFWVFANLKHPSGCWSCSGKTPPQLCAGPVCLLWQELVCGMIFFTPSSLFAEMQQIILQQVWALCRAIKRRLLVSYSHINTRRKPTHGTRSDPR